MKCTLRQASRNRLIIHRFVIKGDARLQIKRVLTGFRYTAPCFCLFSRGNGSQYTLISSKQKKPYYNNSNALANDTARRSVPDKTYLEKQGGL